MPGSTPSLPVRDCNLARLDFHVNFQFRDVDRFKAVHRIVMLKNRLHGKADFLVGASFAEPRLTAPISKAARAALSSLLPCLYILY